MDAHFLLLEWDIVKRTGGLFGGRIVVRNQEAGTRNQDRRQRREARSRRGTLNPNRNEMETEMEEAYGLFQSAIKSAQAAQTRLDELMPTAHTKTPGVKATPEPDDAARRAEQRAAKAVCDEAWRAVRELARVVRPGG